MIKFILLYKLKKHYIFYNGALISDEIGLVTIPLNIYKKKRKIETTKMIKKVSKPYFMGRQTKRHFQLSEDFRITIF